MSRVLPTTFVLLLAATASAQLTYDAGTTGNPAVAPSPATQGWTEQISGGCSVGDVSPDPAQPFNAWQVTDPGSGSVRYSRSLPLGSLQLYEAELTMKPLAGDVYVQFWGGPLINDNVFTFSLRLVGQDVQLVEPNGTPIVFPGAAGGYHTYNFRSGYNWDFAEVRYDGVLLGTFPYSGFGAATGPRLTWGTPDTASGRARVHRAWMAEIGACSPPNTYCVASATSLSGCQASMTSWGPPSLATPDWFKLAAGPVPGGNLGICFFGASGAASVPFGTLGGQICVAPPTYRTAPRTTGGATGVCNGYFAFTLQDLMNAAPIVTPGATLFAEIWGRDPTNADGFLLSDGLRFAACP